MGRLALDRFEGVRIYACAKCGAHLSQYRLILSKDFHGHSGRAYLFERCINTFLGPREDRPLVTGLHTVADLFCVVCHQQVGWKYLEAFDESQKYKEGRIILEKARLTKLYWTPSPTASTPVGPGTLPLAAAASAAAP